jgi:hypothetical protein
VSRSKHLAKKAHLGTGKASLSSTVALALGKEAIFAKCLLVHSAKELTKGALGWPLCRVLVSRTLGKEVAFVECHLIRSTTELVKGPMGGFFAECQYNSKAFAECFPGFVECFWHSIKQLFPIVLCMCCISLSSRHMSCNISCVAYYHQHREGSCCWHRSRCQTLEWTA